jgi:hypothetical protein
MKRATVLSIGPVALFSSACATQPWTPSVPVAYWSQPVVQSRETTGFVQSTELMQRWALSESDPWAPYQKMTLITAADEMDPGTRLPDTNALDVVQSARVAAKRFATMGLPPNTMFVVDLRGPAAVAFGAELSRDSQSPVSLVLTFNNWPAEDEIIPAEETLAQLVHERPAVQNGGGTPVFLLDAWRLAFRFDEADDGWVDNRYMVIDMPTTEMLASQGIKHIIYVVESLDETDVEEDDMHDAFAAYQAAGVRVSMMDLNTLEERAIPYPWDALMQGTILDVTPRPLVINDPHFYVGAHGGFGGLRATPGHAGGHAHWGGGGFHGGGHGGG